ncbi:hypothetical protein [Piscirickettsia litoralis]|uniref:hypothetical protein n=1 Tax=Piscirickettsia litoralis TaxID=1891921 RepID=UPI00130186C7|nr:hypothetical protein [Piscirickettsia litoralis]
MNTKCRRCNAEMDTRRVSVQQLCLTCLDALEVETKKIRSTCYAAAMSSSEHCYGWQ